LIKVWAAACPPNRQMAAARKVLSTRRLRLCLGARRDRQSMLRAPLVGYGSFLFVTAAINRLLLTCARFFNHSDGSRGSPTTFCGAYAAFVPQVHATL
jgi:hypothetical protein